MFPRSALPALHQQSRQPHRKRSGLLKGLAALQIVLASTAAAQTQFQCEPLSPDDPYGYRDRGNRCEGRFHPGLAGTSTLRVVSYSEGLISGQWRDSVRLRWRPIQLDSARIRLRSLRYPIHYQLDAEVGARVHRFSFPADIVDALQLGPENIGFELVGFPPSWQGNGFLMPLLLSESTPSEFFLTVLPGRHLQEIEVGYLNARRVNIVPATPLRNGYYPGGVPVRIALPATLPELVVARLTAVHEDGRTTIEVLLFVPQDH
jgi:hypothetical protein